MKLLLYEYLTGGGLWAEEPSTSAPSGGLFREGRAMVVAVSQDVALIPDVELIRFEDARFAGAVGAEGDVVSIHGSRHELEQLQHWSRQVDGTILIAPESGNRLLDRCRWVQRAGGTLLSPDAGFVALATDKRRTAERLALAGVATPVAAVVEPGDRLPRDFPYPAVLKPNDGAGSVDTRIVWSASCDMQVESSDRMRLEQYCRGAAVSVSALCGPSTSVRLLPCRQRVSDDGRLHYLGGELPLTEQDAARARRLARQTLAALPMTRGYVGLDMILGEAPSDRDVVLDVNPRLTTSYVGLRRSVSSNLAAAMLSVARGQRVSLDWRPGVVRFEADGRVEVEHEVGS